MQEPLKTKITFEMELLGWEEGILVEGTVYTQCFIKKP